MLVLSREVGESVIIEDVLLTLARVGDGYVEVSLVKIAGGKKTILTLPLTEAKPICYNVTVTLVDLKGTKARFGFEYPPEVTITRQKSLEPGGDECS